MQSPTSAGGNFNGVAPAYDALTFAVFRRRLQRAQVVFLDQIPPDSSVLMVGGGTGWLLEQVLTRCRPKQVIYLDTSAQMVARASRRIIQNAVPGSIDFRVNDESVLSPNDQFDVILAPFILDLFSAQTLQNQLIPRLHNALKINGFWLVTDFVQPRSWWQRILLWAMIHFFRFTAGIEARQLADWQRLLREAGLIRQQQQHQLDGMVSAEVWTRHP